MRSWSRLNGFNPAPHHELLIDCLEKAATVPNSKYIFCLPRGAAKSTYGSKLFPPWALADRPTSAWSPKCILAASHNKDLIQSFGRDCRNRIERFSKELGYTLRRDSKAADEWATSNGKDYFCAGVGAGIAGHRGDLGLLDDYFGSVEDADSELNRERVWDWFWADFIGCLNPGASIVIIATRWHEKDLIGRLLEQERELWNLISVPLLAKHNDPLGRQPGECLWRERYDDEKVRQAKAVPRIFFSVWQQEPSPEDGDYFKKDALDKLGYTPEQLPQDLRMNVGSDHAISKREEADKSCFVPVGVDPSGVLWVLPDVRWDRWDSDEQVNQMFELAQSLDRKYGSVWWVAEKEKITQCLGPYLFKKMRDEGHFFVIDQVTPKKDKQWRARTLQALVNAGMIRFPFFAPWWAAARREMLAFDKLGEDDFVDALAHVARRVNALTPADVPPASPPSEEPADRGVSITGKELREMVESRNRERLVTTLDM